MRIVNTDPGTTVLSHEGKIYEAVRGVFEVPEEVGQALIGFPHWLHEHEAVDRAAAAKAAADTDPAQMAARLAELEAAAKTAADAAARVKELEAENAALKAAAAETSKTSETDTSAAKADKVPRAAKKAAAPADKPSA